MRDDVEHVIKENINRRENNEVKDGIKTTLKSLYASDLPESIQNVIKDRVVINNGSEVTMATSAQPGGLQKLSAA